MLHVSRSLHMRFVLFVLVAILVCSAQSTAEDAVSKAAIEKIVATALADDFAYGWLEELCDSVGHRLAGSPEMDAAIDFSVKSLREAGFDRVWTEPFAVPVWQRGRESARVTAPVRFELPILGLGRSVGTAPGGIEAEVLAVSDFDELEARAAEASGKIVLFNPPWEGYGKTVKYRAQGASAAARHGAVAALVRSVTGVSLATPHTGVMRYEDGVPKIPTAAVTVEDAGRIQRLTQSGATVRVHLMMEATTLPDREQPNVIAEVTGRERPHEIVLVGGHLDSWDAGTGAHDDGAGCAIAVAAARLLIDPELRPRRTVRVVLFNAEEFGGYGGDAYLEAHSSELDQHVAALESDSGCFAPDGFSVKAGPAVIAKLEAAAAPLASVGAAHVRQGWAGVDIDPIVEQGVPGIAHRTRNELYFDYHHSPADTFDKVDKADLDANVAAVAALLYAIAEDPVSLRDIAETGNHTGL